MKNVFNKNVLIGLLLLIICLGILFVLLFKTNKTLEGYVSKYSSLIIPGYLDDQSLTDIEVGMGEYKKFGKNVKLDTNPKGLDIYSFNKEIDFAIYGIYNEASSRFVNPVVVIGHGKSVNGTWTIVPDKDRGRAVEVNRLAWEIGKIHKNRNIVLFICNPEGYTINAPRTWYFRTNVWAIPDKFSRPELEDQPYKRENERYFYNAGSIWETYTGNIIFN